MQATPARPREWTADDDALLGSILALRALDRERGGALTLSLLGLETRVVTYVLSGLCARHGQFVTEWTGRMSEALPLEARCSAAEAGRCTETPPVFVLV